MQQNKAQNVFNILQTLPTQKMEALKKLFWEELNYEPENSPLSYADWPEQVKGFLSGPPILWASAGEGRSFHIILCLLTSAKLSISAERQVIIQLVKGHPFGLYIFTNSTQERWHFINVCSQESEKTRPRRVLRRISISAEDRLRTASERIARLDMSQIPKELFAVPAFRIQKMHEDAFNVEAVTEEFFKAYHQTFQALKMGLETQTRDSTWAHDFSLLFLNRLMFLYYIQRKRWLGNDADFLHNFWRSYNRASRPKDSFVPEWLNILFFEAFNNQFQAGRTDRAYLPGPLRDALQVAPFLNGGLFKKNELDAKYPSAVISDERMGIIFDFLDKYNFTISEDTPLDQEVAVDPEMIGKVYESLVNVSAEADQQRSAGIFYTPRIEIDLMCRLSLVDWLTNHIGKEHKNALYEWVFAFNPEDKSAADEKITRLDLWQKLAGLLNQVAILDPACGSGSFLVGMLYILDDLNIRINQRLGIQESTYQRRKRIIGNCLYGVDVMGWAVQVAELRLWLQLVIETELQPDELRFKPLLPNLTFKVRQGDSLVQEYGGINFNLQSSYGRMPDEVKRSINRLKSEKLKYFDNDPSCKFANEELVRHEELKVFRGVLEDKKVSLQKRLVEIESNFQPRSNLLGEIQKPKMPGNSTSQEQEKVKIQNQILVLENTLRALQSAGHIPLIWDLAFVEVFQSEKSGFDIVIGNPPYVRQEKIRDPGLAWDKVTDENKRAYKAKLQQAVYAAWPNTFKSALNKKNPTWHLNSRSDYYIYFYFLCLRLVNAAGSFCFITSNSWLDVGYGRDLQGFLLKHAHIKLIIDNQVKRSFAAADVNTIIVLLSAGEDRPANPEGISSNGVRFILFKVGFENGLDAVLWDEIEECGELKSTPEYRCMLKTQKDLLQSGMDDESGTFAGDKWGGKFLRAPDIYWKILEKAGDKLVRLGDIAEVRFGIKTGANKFFYLDEEKIQQWGIEEEYLKPIIKSPRECKRILTNEKDLHLKVFLCGKSKEELIGTNALKYIEWGESNNFHKVKTVRNRKYWWDLGIMTPSNYLWSMTLRERFFVAKNNGFFADARLYDMYCEDYIGLACNSTWILLQLELMARSYGGGGGPIDIKVYEVKDLLLPNL